MKHWSKLTDLVYDVIYSYRIYCIFNAIAAFCIIYNIGNTEYWTIMYDLQQIVSIRVGVINGFSKFILHFIKQIC